ncbi:UvrD/REP helicase [Acidithiobacillus ferrivorans]|uniref:DNA 3'-5' helicase n=1 Tax=Acidithiobacillus ferrivorans TaxID=160808 RepID=A0A060UUJ5_9PROT|nr:UvrD-helicase domain-containing protein [Acidithiobacillus ferrivorans]CDQ10438.1 UvrD/REP helicase [Acidithiobacillus ferrivorans]SMH64464.1 UvrD/REP helicase [Acidithiobacillus ferrivorans]
MPLPQSWRPSIWGKLFTSAKPWRLSIEGDQFRLDADGQVMSDGIIQLEKLSVDRGIFWASVQIESAGGASIVLDGISNTTAKRMHRTIAAAIADIRHQQHIANLIGRFGPAVNAVTEWATATKTACIRQMGARGWLTSEFVELVATSRPRDLESLLGVPEIGQHLARQPRKVQDAVAFWKRPFPDVADSINSKHTAKELIDSRTFFDKVEKSPLTQEQAEAVICFDSRVLLVAAAGSGKTSTMVAKAGYALKKGYFPAERMLLLAFNADAAAELRERIKARLEPLGLPADRIVAKTFHAFGLEVIGIAAGRRPSLAPWVETGRDVEALLEMVDELKDSDPEFRTSWDMFRLVFGQDLPEFGAETDDPEAWDRSSGHDGFWTLNNEVVRSRGEVIIANWLFYNGIRYEYEKPYKFDTADSAHRQYLPDFHLPDVDTYLEHWALDARGEPPPAFTGYKIAMEWKKRIHTQMGTHLLETTTAGLWSGEAFRYLEQELTKLWIILDPNPDREVPGRKPIENPRLANTIRSFLTHAKSNRLSMADLRKRLEENGAGRFRYRHEMFLNLFEKLWQRWEERLKAESCIDFEDMLNMAANCLEQNLWNSPYELVMVDEFQDASQARVRLISGLVRKPGRCLFAVGDDWQSINRFAGADLSAMTNFGDSFGKVVTLKLETTFRCPQSLCDISSRFVQKNPKQLRKSVQSARADVSVPVRIVSVSEESKIRSAVEALIEEIAAECRDSERKSKIYILGRYRKDKAYLPPTKNTRLIEVEFFTMHSSKGLEADHVIIPRITSETLGFPSRVMDDPVLQIAMPSGDTYGFAEERRLFYVALTRARKTVTLVTVARKESAFVMELAREHQIKVINADGSKSINEICPGCGNGFLVERKGPYGPFLGCSNFPKCKHRRKAAVSEAGRRHSH